MNLRALLNENKCREMIAWIEKNPGNLLSKIRKETQGTYHTWRQIEHLTNVRDVPGKTPPALPIRRNDQPFSIRTDFHLTTRTEKAKELGAREGEKLCYKCVCLKPISEFHTVNSRPDGRAQYCRPCTQAYNQDWAKRTDEKRVKAGLPPRVRRQYVEITISSKSKLEIPATTLTRWIPGTLYARNSVY
jgi:hypothetical protein